jgi:hypothetical protein
MSLLSRLSLLRSWGFARGFAGGGLSLTTAGSPSTGGLGLGGRGLCGRGLGGRGLVVCSSVRSSGIVSRWHCGRLPTSSSRSGGNGSSGDDGAADCWTTNFKVLG